MHGFHGHLPPSLPARRGLSPAGCTHLSHASGHVSVTEEPPSPILLPWQQCQPITASCPPDVLISTRELTGGEGRAGSTPSTRWAGRAAEAHRTRGSRKPRKPSPSLSHGSRIKEGHLECSVDRPRRVLGLPDEEARGGQGRPPTRPRGGICHTVAASICVFVYFTEMSPQLRDWSHSRHGTIRAPLP